MRAISHGNIYDIYDDTLKTYDKLPAQTYIVRFSQNRGFYLEKYVEMEITESKIYGAHTEKVFKVLNSFEKVNRSLGVMISMVVFWNWMIRISRKRRRNWTKVGNRIASII